MMKSLNKYLQKQGQRYHDDVFDVNFNSDIIVVIPCYDEPDIINTLESIRRCDRPESVNLSVIVIINSAVKTDIDVVNRNTKTYQEVSSYSKKIDERSFIVRAAKLEGLPNKHAGVGLARKIGMDLAVEHFYKTENYRGIIVSLDADCEVSDNFITTVYNTFRSDGNLNATIHNFHHRVESSQSNIEFAVRQYESYLHYYSECLKSTGFPYYYHTIGSAFAVSANAYVRVGGMGRQQGGEDFIFYRKCFN